MESGTCLGQPVRPLAKRLKSEDLRQDGAKNAIVAIGIATILIPAVVAILIAATESLAEVVVVVTLIYVVAVVPVVRVLIGVRILVVGAPPILAVCASGEKALLVTVINGLAEKISPVLIRLEVIAATMITKTRSRVVVRITIVIVVVVLEKYLLLVRALQILLLKTVLRRTLIRTRPATVEPFLLPSCSGCFLPLLAER